MTPKEKAKELIYKYEYFVRMYNDDTPRKDMQKKSALIAVDEILFVLNEIDSTEQWNASWFYNQVKQEIEKL